MATFDMNLGLSGDKKLAKGTLNRARDSLELELIKRDKKLSFKQAQRLDAGNEGLPKEHEAKTGSAESEQKRRKTLGTQSSRSTKK